MTEIERLLAIEAIKNLKARYLRLVNIADWDAWPDTMTEDCVMVFGEGPNDIFEGRDTIVSSIRKALSHATAFHQCHTPEIEITGPDSAKGIWSLHGGSVLNDGSTPMAQSFAYYDDDYRRCADGKWRVSRMVVNYWLRLTNGDPHVLGETTATVIKIS